MTCWSCSGFRTEDGAHRNIPVRRAEIRVVEHIESLKPHLDLAAFSQLSNFKPLEDAGVEIDRARTAKNIAPGITEGEWRGIRERGGVEKMIRVALAGRSRRRICHA